jgi:putative ABC transport system ATP-binding protein
LTVLQSPAAIRAVDLSFAWPKQKPLYTDVSFELYPGQKLLITGPSGSGKSTLLNLLAGVVEPSSGSIWIHEETIQGLSASAKDQLRGEQMGFIFQQFNLLPYLSVRDNILLPAHLFTKRKAAALTQFGSLEHALRYYMNHLGLSADLENQAAHRLSIGQQQRVAAARAFLGKPSIVIADEPTSALDEANQTQLLKLFFALANEQQTALLMVSHDPRLSPYFDRQLQLAELSPS